MLAAELKNGTWQVLARGHGERQATAASEGRAVDPSTGWQIPPITAALCLMPRGQLTPSQARKLESLKQAPPSFATLRRLAMRFRGLLRGSDAAKLGAWLRDARASGIGAMQRFARRLGRDLEAARNAVAETWSNGQTEGQVNKLKTLKRAMHGRAGDELPRARLLPLEIAEQARRVGQTPQPNHPIPTSSPRNPTSATQKGVS